MPLLERAEQEILDGLRISDRDKLALPHPKRIEVSHYLSGLEELLGDELPELLAMLAQNTAVSQAHHWCLNHAGQFPRIAAFFRNNSASSGHQNLQIFRQLRLQGRLFVVRDGLDMELRETDIGTHIPAQFMTLPYPDIYLQFGEHENSPYIVKNEQTGDHVLEGVYIHESTCRAIPNVTVTPFLELYGLKEAAPTRILDFTVIGKPKDTILDDAFFTISMHIQDEEEPIEALLRQQLAGSRELARRGGEPLHFFDDGYIDGLICAVEHAAKALLYLNGEGAEMETRAEYSEMRRKITTLGAKKAAKATRKLDKVYDKIVVGPARSEFREDYRLAQMETRSGVRPHWRRGHFRTVRYGEGRALRKPVRIPPILVNKAKIGEAAVPVKEYNLK